MRSFRYLLSIVLFFCCFQMLWSQQKYVIVSPSEFRETLRPFVEWKRQTGFMVVECYVDTNSPDAIRQLLQSHYDRATLLNPAPSYVLLVGDVDRIGTFEGRHCPNSSFASISTDLYYVEYTGDSRPEAMLGRWSVADEDQLADVVVKTLRYERFLLPTRDYLNRALVVAGRETSTAGVNVPVLTNGHVDYVSRALRETSENIDTACFYNPDSENRLDTILSLLRQGRGLVSYTSHCIAEGWLHPSLDSRIIDTLSESFPSVYLNNCCLSSRFVEDCFGEHLLRKPQGGAVGVIGASSETLWNEDYYWAIGAKFPFSRTPVYNASLLGMFDRWLHRFDESLSCHAATLGQMLFAGNESVGQFESPYEDYYWEIYNILGDPSLMPYVGVPDPLPLSCEDVVIRGAGTLVVSTLPDALVAVVQDSVLLGVAVADSMGQAEVQFNHSALADTLCVTATLQNHIPAAVAVPVRHPAGAHLAITDYSVEVEDSATIHLVVTNVGDDTAFSHCVLTDEAGVCLDTVAPNASQSVLLRLPFVADTLPLFKTVVCISDAAGCYASIPVCCDVAVDYPLLQSVVVLDSSDTLVHTLSTGQSYSLHATFAARADSMQITIIEYPSLRKSHTICYDTLREGILPFRLDAGTRRFKVSISSFLGNWRRTYDSWMLVDAATETFESGDFSRFPWDTTALRPWILSQTQTHESHFSASSATITSRQTSRLSLPLYVIQDDTVSFWTRISSEEGHDRLYFYIDDQLQGYWSGISMWTLRSFPITQGRHLLTWRYGKDDSRNENQDCVWIDDIHFPLAMWDTLDASWDTTTVSLETPPAISPFVNVYPNPAGSQCHIAVSEEFAKASLRIYDMQGRCVANYATVPEILSLHPFRSGIYTLVFQNHQARLTRKLIIEKR